MPRSSDHRKSPPTSRETFEPPATLVPEIVMLGHDSFTRAAPDRLNAHQHRDAWEMCYIVRGQVSWWVDRQIHSPTRGQWFFTRPDELHGGVDAVMHPCELYWLQVRLSPDRAATGLDNDETQTLRLGLDQLERRTFNADDSVTGLFTDLLQAHRQRDELSSVRARTLLHHLLLQLLDDHAAAGPQTAEPTGRDPALARLLNRIDQHLDADHRVSDLAAELRMSEDSFRALFMEQVGLPPAEYVTRRRVQRACDLLVQTDQSVTRIAQTVGFATGQYFATAFRRLIGASPTWYRRQHRPY